MIVMMVTVFTMIGVDNPNCYLAGGHLNIFFCEKNFSSLFFVTLNEKVTARRTILSANFELILEK